MALAAKSGGAYVALEKGFCPELPTPPIPPWLLDVLLVMASSAGRGSARFRMELIVVKGATCLPLSVHVLSEDRFEGGFFPRTGARGKETDLNLAEHMRFDIGTEQAVYDF